MPISSRGISSEESIVHIMVVAILIDTSSHNDFVSTSHLDCILFDLCGKLTSKHKCVVLA